MIKSKQKINKKGLKHLSARASYAIDFACAGFQAADAQSINRRAKAKGKRHNLVTDGDLASQQAIVKAIRSKFPGDGIIGEEKDLKELNDSGFNWFIDPIDGTFNFSRELDPWAVSVGGVKNGITEFGAIVNSRGISYIAEKGKGAYRNGKIIHVSGVKSLKDAVIYTDSPYNDALKKINFSILADLTPTGYSTGSLVANAALVAEGKADLYFCAGFGGAWDITAAISIVQEAGGAVYDLLERRDLTGEKNSYKAKSIVLGNKKLVRQFMDAVKPILERFKSQ